MRVRQVLERKGVGSGAHKLIFTLNEVIHVQGRMREGKHTCSKSSNSGFPATRLLESVGQQ